MDLLLQNSVNVNSKDRWDSTPLSDALRSGNIEVARMLIEKGAHVAYDDLTASGELCEFARAGKLERIEGLLDGGCNIDAADYDDRTCIHLAACTGNLLVVHALIEHKADLSLTHLKCTDYSS